MIILKVSASYLGLGEITLQSQRGQNESSKTGGSK